MAMTLKKERASEQVMSLSPEIQKAIADTIKLRQNSEISAVVSEVIETLGGQDPNLIVRAIKSAGGPREFVQEIQTEIRRLKSIGAHKS